VLSIALKRPAARVAVRIAAPAVSVTASLAHNVRHRRAGRQTVTLKVGDAARNLSTLKLRLRPS
jgi:hypothetical protein